MRKEKLKILILEDVSSDAELIQLFLNGFEYSCEFEVTDNKGEYIRLLTEFTPDLIISDYNLPQFDGLSALKILRSSDVITPFIFVSGTLGEENAVKAIKCGATDLLVKSRIEHLPAAILRALREKSEKKERELVVRQLVESEKRFKALIQNGSDLIAILSYTGEFLFLSNTYHKILGIKPETYLGKNIFKLIHTADRASFSRCFAEIIEARELTFLPYRIKNSKKEWRWVETTATNLSEDPSVKGIVFNSRDISSRKHKEEIRDLMGAISFELNQPGTLADGLFPVLRKLGAFVDASLVEAWMVAIDETKINLVARWVKDSQAKKFVENSQEVVSLTKGEGLPGIAWAEMSVQSLYSLAGNKKFVRQNAAAASNLDTCYGIPIVFNDKVVSVFTFFSTGLDKTRIDSLEGLFYEVGQQIGAELQRKKSQDDLDRFFDISLDLLCVVGMDGFFKRINFAFTKLLGYAEEKLLQTKFVEFVHPDDKHATYKEIQDLSEGRATRNFVNRFVTKDGGIVWLLWSTSTMPEEGVMFAVAKDVTESKLLEKEREDILNSITDGFFAFDKDWNVTFWNNSAERMLNLEGKEIVGKNLLNLFFQQESPSIFNQFRSSIDNQQVRVFEIHFSVLDAWIEISTFPKKNGLSVYLKDITEPKKQKLEILRIKNNREALINSTNDIIFSVDTHLNLISANHAFHEKVKSVLQMSIDEGQKLPPEAMNRKNLEHLWKGFFQRAFDGEQFTVTMEDDFYKTDIKYSLVSLNPIIDNEKCIGAACFIKDITEKVKYLKAIEEQNSVLKEIAWTQSHVVRAPLARLVGLVNLLTRDAVPPTDKERVLNGITHSAKELDEIIKEIVRKTENLYY